MERSLKREVVFIEDPPSHSKTERHTYKRIEANTQFGLADTQYPAVAMPVPLPLSLPLRQSKRQKCKCCPLTQSLRTLHAHA